MAPKKNHGQLTGAAKAAQSALVQQKLSNPQVGQRPGETATVYAPGVTPPPQTAAPSQPKPTSLSQVLKIGGGSGGAIGKGELVKILDAGRDNVSGGQVVRRLDKINERLADKDMTGINLTSGAANYLIRRATKAPPMSSFFKYGGDPIFGPGKIGQALQGMLGTRATGGYINPQSGQQSMTPGKARTLLPRGMDLMPSGRQTVRGIGKQFTGIPVAGENTNLPSTTETVTGGEGTDQIQAPVIKPEEEKVPQMGMSIDEAIANWASGFKTARSSRKRAGRGAQTLSETTRVTPTGGFRGGM